MADTGGSVYRKASNTHALAVRVLTRSRHLQHAHAKGVDVYTFVVVLLVHFGSHEFGRDNHRFGERAILQSGQTQVADLDAASRSRDENVVALHRRNRY